MSQENYFLSGYVLILGYDHGRFKMAEEGEFVAELKRQAIESLALWCLGRFELWTDWESSSITEAERVDTLKLLGHLAVINTRMSNLIDNTPEFAAYRLAEADVAADRIHHQVLREQEDLLSRFDSNWALFCSSWALETPMADFLRIAEFEELSLSELIEVRRCITFGWATEVNIPCIRSNNLDPSVWITPALKL